MFVFPTKSITASNGVYRVCNQRRVALFFLSEIKLHKFSQDDRGALIQTSHRDSTKSIEGNFQLQESSYRSLWNLDIDTLYIQFEKIGQG